jgi:O-antigen/teichoic acid export membrane protein
MLLGSLAANIPVYVIEHLKGVAQAGYYSAACTFMGVGALIAAALGQSVMSQLSHEFVRDRQRYRATLRKMLLLSSAMGGAAVIVARMIGRDTLALLYGADYASYEAVLLWITIAAAFSFPASLFGLSLTISRRFNAGLMVHIISIASVSILAGVFVPSHGLVGGAWALAGGTAIRVVLSGALVYLDLKSR